MRTHLLSALSSLVFGAACAASPRPAEDPAQAATVTLDAMISDRDVPGLQYLVVDQSGVLCRHTAGVSDAATGAAMSDESVLMAYSISKAVTAVAVLQLVEAGAIELDRPLSDYFGEHPYGAGVTIRSLLAQTSGVPNPMPLDWFAAGTVPTNSSEKLRSVLAQNDQLDHVPGTEYAYSNLSYWLLEKAVEGASGLGFDDYVRERIWQPLGVGEKEASFEAVPGHTATGHATRVSAMTWVAEFMTPSEYWSDSSGPWARLAPLRPHGLGYGGLFSNASALGALLGDLLRPEPRLVNRTTKDLMFTRQHTSDGEPIAMTLGWVTGELHGVPYFGKQGGGLGFHGNVRLYPTLGIATVFLANQTEIAADPIDERTSEVDRWFVVR